MSCFEKEVLRAAHNFLPYGGGDRYTEGVLPKCYYCGASNPQFEVRKECYSHFAWFNVFGIYCSKRCRSKGKKREKSPDIVFLQRDPNAGDAVWAKFVILWVNLQSKSIFYDHKGSCDWVEYVPKEKK